MRKRSNDFDELFISHLNEFIKAPITKFDEVKRLTFSDGTLMCNWYKKNTSKLKEYNIEIAKKLSQERLEYRDTVIIYELEHDPVLLKKLEYFKNYKCVSKFYLDFKLSDQFGPKFEGIDSTSLIGFWRYYKRFIEKSDLKVCKDIVSQYNDMLLNNPHNSNSYRFKEFIAEPNLSKFSKDGVLKFTDGYSMYNYWINNYEELIKISPRIRVEYKKFQKQKKDEEATAKKALESLEENQKLRKVFSYYFTNLTLERLEKFSALDSSKFDIESRNLLLDNNVTVYDFWALIKTPLKKLYEICKDKDEKDLVKREKYTITIYKQFEEYILNKELKKFEKEQSEFENLSCRKFISTTDTKLSSGKNVYDWWLENRDKLYQKSIEDEVSSNIVNQYERFAEMTYGISTIKAYSDENLDEIDSWCYDMGYIKKL